MLIKRAPMFKASEITDYRLYLNRREFMRGGGGPGPRAGGRLRRRRHAPAGQPLEGNEEREV